MELNRRDFVLLTAAACAGCASGGAKFPAIQGRAVDLGPADAFAAEGVYDHSRDQGLFVLRHSEKLVVISAICTHRGCRVNEDTGGTFCCPCHGSQFDAQGHVTHGPAEEDLPRLPSTIQNGRLIVNPGMQTA